VHEHFMIGKKEDFLREMSPHINGMAVSSMMDISPHFPQKTPFLYTPRM